MNHPNQKHIALLLAIFSLKVVLVLPDTVHALTIAWDQPVNHSAAGYKIYCGKYGTDFKSSPIQTIHSIDQTSCTISGLEEGQTYCFAATSIDSAGNESDFSDIVYYNVPETNDDSDIDGDGYSENQGDCNDDDNTIHPDAIDVCGDGIDQDCDGSDTVCPDTLNGKSSDGGEGCFIDSLF